jgi:hypothetical protein
MATLITYDHGKKTRKPKVKTAKSKLVKMDKPKSTELPKPARRIRVRIASTKRIDKPQKEFLKKGHPSRIYAAILKFAPIEAPRQLIPRVPRKPHPLWRESCVRLVAKES